MINTTKDEIVFNQSGSALDSSVRSALDVAAGWVLKAHGLETINLEDVTTKTYQRVAFAAYVKLCILKKPNFVFDERYVLDAFEAFSLPYSAIPEEHFYKVTFAEQGSALTYKKTYAKTVRPGIGAFLVALHGCGAITLPFSFRWPISWEYDNEGRKKRTELCDVDSLPELLRFIRSLKSQADTQEEAVFNTLTKDQREGMSYLGTRILLATGWLTPSDAKYEDLLALKDQNEKTQFTGLRDVGLGTLIDILERKYGSEMGLSVAGWRDLLNQKRLNPAAKAVRNFISIEERLGIANLDDEYLLAEVSDLLPTGMNPEKLEELKVLPGLDIVLSDLTKTWLKLERAYIKKTRLESYKAILNSLGYLNIYLFAYLPYWYAKYPDCSIAFPSEPAKLISSIFISDLGLADEVIKPQNFLEFLAYIALKKEWKPQTHYGTLKPIEKFFEFLEQYGDELPGCKGFRQMLSSQDYPAQTRSSGTSKRPIPRRIFSFYLAYVEALIAHTEALLNRILSGDIDADALAYLDTKFAVIDTFARQEAFGFIPVIFHKGKAIPLRYIPNTVILETSRLKDGRLLRIPQPHALNHILVVLHTGIRNNHVQWLDAETFDAFVEEGTQDFTTLFVNTDKVKTKGWKAHVHPRVIDILRKQLHWRMLLDEPGFLKKIPYNNNERSKWGTFYPLFSAGSDGRPYNDSRYENTWKKILIGVQAMLPDIGETKIRSLCRLLPSEVLYDDIDIDRKLHEYGKKEQRVCSLIIKSDITPHSARVSVVSHSISVLPADVIGKYLTGQNEATVYHYVVLDDDEVYAEQQLQKLSLRQKGFDEGYDAMLSGGKTESARFIKADTVNSRLSLSLRSNFEETLMAYGCISLSLNDNIKNGIDILRETRAVGAVENKTEICPYGNHCPPDLIKELQGIRRCGICPYAVRSIDHLPAVAAKGRQILEMLNEVELKLDDKALEEKFTPEEIDLMEGERGRLAEEITAWQLVGDVLELTRQQIASGASDKKWVVQKPEIIERDLKRVPFPSSGTEYVLARLPESVAYPMLDSPQIKARFDLLRRQLLANTGKFREAFNPQTPENPAAECLGLIRSVVTANKLTHHDLLEMLDTDNHLNAFPYQSPRLLTSEV